jgi:predicted tellurium resistance membrane protein TerC
VVELLLSTDNICLFHQIFEHFKVPREVRPGLLFVGTPFMVAVRGVMFFALKEVYNSVRPIMFAIGLFCLYQGCYVIWVTCTGQDEDKDDPATSAVVVWGKWAFGDRLITHYEGSAFWVYVQGAAKLTPMFLCMAVIEVTDVMFCVDGVSTIFMVRLRVQGPRAGIQGPKFRVCM